MQRRLSERALFPCNSELTFVESAMTSGLSRFLLLVSMCCAVLLSMPAGLHAADPVQKTDDAGWILPGANIGTGWHLRLKDARLEAAKDGKPILILFSGPDWSSASKRFESSVLHSKKFVSGMLPAVVGLYVQHFVNTDAPEEQVSANQSLRKALAVPAVYPCTVILASDGKKILGMIPGALDENTYIERLSELTGIRPAE